MEKDLASTIAHKINNPLMIISGSAQLALMEEINNKTVEDNLKVILEQCERIKDIIQKLLLSKQEEIGNEL